MASCCVEERNYEQLITMTERFIEAIVTYQDKLKLYQPYGVLWAAMQIIADSPWWYKADWGENSFFEKIINNTHHKLWKLIKNEHENIDIEVGQKDVLLRQGIFLIALYQKCRLAQKDILKKNKDILKIQLFYTDLVNALDNVREELNISVDEVERILLSCFGYLSKEIDICRKCDELSPDDKKEVIATYSFIYKKLLPVIQNKGLLSEQKVRLCEKELIRFKEMGSDNVF
jgi:hypothetical protein